MSDISHTSAVSKLPSEILAKIFFRVTRGGVCVVDLGPYPWRLALVCRLWRDIAFSTPRLWSGLDVQLDSIQPSRMDVHVDALVAVCKLCLKRSGDRPLTVVLWTSPETMAFIPALLEPLVDHAGRWETMTFGFPLDILLPFISDPGIRYPRLHYLLLQGRGFLGSGNPPPLQLFQSAPLLSQLELHEFSYPPIVLKFPWSQITELTVRMSPLLGIRHLLDGLQNMPNISSLTYSQFVDMSPPVPSTPQSNQVLQLPHLHRLAWKTYRSKGTPFFDWICTPKLSEVEFTCEDDHWDSDTMLRFLRRSKCTITSLRLNRMTPTVATSFLKLLPDVEVLTLEKVEIDRDLTYALTFDESNPSWVAPKLKVMVLLDAAPGEEVCNAFADMIQSRLRVPLHEEGRGNRLGFFRIKETFRSDEPMQDPLVSSMRWRLSTEDMVLFTHQEEDNIVTDAWRSSSWSAHSREDGRHGGRQNFPGEAELLWDYVDLASRTQAERW